MVHAHGAAPARHRAQKKNERLEILKQVYCETHRGGEARLPPGLVMALIDGREPLRSLGGLRAGAVGLMQVMPFWPEQLGMRRYELVHVAPNIHMGCAILRFYLGYEHNDVRKALARYNGSIGRRDYPDLVIDRWTRWNGADDLGFPARRPRMCWTVAAALLPEHRLRCPRQSALAACVLGAELPAALAACAPRPRGANRPHPS